MDLNPAQKDFMREQWVEYSIMMFFLALRFYARWKVVGFLNFSWDDLFAGFSMVSCDNVNSLRVLIETKVFTTSGSVLLQLIRESS